MLNVFQEGRSHMAIVSRRSRRIEHDADDAESVMTAAAGGLRQRFMRKVAEISHTAKSGSDSSGSDHSPSDTDEDVERGEKRNKKKAKNVRKSHSSGSSPTAVSQGEQEEVEKKKPGLAQAAKLNQLEQSVPADAQMPPSMVEKVSLHYSCKSHAKCNTVL